MFAFHQHFEKLYTIQWYFPEHQKKYMEEKLYVVFEKQDDHYLLQEVLYAYMDIVTGMDGIDFICEKKGETMKIKILNI